MTGSSPELPPPLPRRSRAGAPPLPEETPRRVQDFWQQAQALVALEQGLTPSCHVKLASLAQELQLSDDEYEQALTRLRSPAEPAAPPSLADQLAAKYRAYLDRKLAKLDNPMLDLTRERHYLDVARDRYGLDEPAARRVLDGAASEHGVKRITIEEATRIVNDMVAEKLGDAVWIDHAAAQRIIVAGQVWGLSAVEVDQLLRARTKANRARVAAEQLKQRLLYGAAGVAILGVAFFVGWLASQRRLSDVEKADEETTAGIGSADAAASSDASSRDAARRGSAPDWWDARLAVAVSKARANSSSFRSLYEGLISRDGATRGGAYRRVVEWAATAPARDEEEQPPAILARELLVSAYAQEPDENAAASLADALVNVVRGATDREAIRTAEARRAIWGLETAWQAAGRAKPERAASLLNQFAEPLQFRHDEDAVPAQSRPLALAALAKRVLQLAARRAVDDPASALEIHDAIREAAAHLPVDEFQRLQTALVVAALPAAGTRWTIWRPLLFECASASGDAVALVPLIELYERAGDAPWRDTLGELLSSRAGARVDLDNPDEVARAVRQGLGLAVTASNPLPLDAWNKLRGPANAALARATAPTASEAEWLARALELSHWTTLAQAAAHGDAGRPAWDAGWRDGPPKLPAPRAVDPDRGGARAEPFGDRDPARGRIGAGPTIDPRVAQLRRNQLQRYLGQLEHFERLEPVPRVNAVRQIGLAASELPDLSPVQGQYLARYLLADRSESERLGTAEAARLVLDWPQVQLGIADFLESSKLSANALAELLSHLLGRAVTAAEADTQRPALRRELLLRVFERMAGRVPAMATAEIDGAAADEAGAALVTQFGQRASLLGIDSTRITSEASPGRAAAALAREIAARQTSSRSMSDLDRRWLGDFPLYSSAAEYQSTTDLHRLIAWERLLTRLGANELLALHPDHAAAAGALVAQALAESPVDASPLEQLARLEALQLRLWLLPASPARNGSERKP